VQAVCYLLFFLPLRQRLSFNQRVSNTWWELWCFVQETWHHIPFRITGDALRSNENAILIGNHNAGVDFTVGVSVLSRATGIGCGRMMTMMKFVLQFVPMVGFTHRLQGSLFLRRNWEQDQRAIAGKLKEMEQGDFPRPFWIGIYPEGTRITEHKREESLKFAASRNLPLLQNVLLPRTKGFTFLVKSLPTAMNCLYDTTIAYGGKEMYVEDIFMSGGYKTEGVHVHVQRIEFSSLPQPVADQPAKEWDAALDKWLLDRFVIKDKLLTHFKEHGYFPGDVPPSHLAPHHRFTLIWAAWSLSFSFFLLWWFSSPMLFVVTGGLALFAIYTALSTPTPILNATECEAQHQIRLKAKEARAAMKAGAGIKEH